VSGIGLKDAKDVADAMRDGWQIEFPSFKMYLHARDCSTENFNVDFLRRTVQQTLYRLHNPTLDSGN
jgi:hypothetical protein